MGLEDKIHDYSKKLIEGIGKSKIAGVLGAGLTSIGIGLIPLYTLSNEKIIHMIAQHFKPEIETALHLSLPIAGTLLTGFYFIYPLAKKKFKKIKYLNPLKVYKKSRFSDKREAGIAKTLQLAFGIFSIYAAMNSFPKVKGSVETSASFFKENIENVFSRRKGKSLEEELSEISEKKSLKKMLYSKDFKTREKAAKKLIEIIGKEKGYQNINLIYAIGRGETNFNPKAVSYTGVKGLMQLTQKVFEEFKDKGYKDINDPEASIRAAMNYTKYLYKYLEGKVSKKYLDEYVIIAYNLGPTNVVELIKRGFPKDSPYLFVEKLVKSTKRKPIEYNYGKYKIKITKEKAKETRNYLYKVNWWRSDQYWALRKTKIKKG